MPQRRKLITKPDQEGLLDSIQGYYTATILLQLSRLGVLEKLASPIAAIPLAREHQLDPLLLEQLLEFLAQTTSIILKKGKQQYRLGEIRHIELSFQLEKFVGAYGPAVHALGDVLGKKVAGKACVDRLALANAFAAAKNFVNPFIPALIMESGIHCLLDLGCGSASLLIELAKTDDQFHGIGVDSSKEMCRYARQAVREAHLTRRITVKQGDGSNLKGKFSTPERARVEALHGRSFLNEFFAAGDREVVEVLRRLRVLFRHRTAWFSDYYGVLGQRVRSPGDFQLTLLQDVAQAVSGQGVPPPDLRRWRGIYRKARCNLRRAHEFQGSGIRWFIHEVEF